MSNYFITFNTLSYYTVLLSPGLDILSNLDILLNLNYFPKGLEFDQKIAQKFKCRTFAGTHPPLCLNIDACIITGS